MSHSRYLSFIALAGAFSWIGFALVLFKLNPFESLGMSLSLFFITFFLALLCSFSLVGFYFRLFLNRNEIYYEHINISLRQGLFLSIVVIIALALQLLGVLSWWTGLLLVFCMTLLEFYSMLRSHH
ncbi:MAG: hypothetical protein AAB551_04025 [Patescibacteria group bacterium]